jgi:hypothetical protein
MYFYRLILRSVTVSSLQKHNTGNLLKLRFNGESLKSCNFSKDQRGLPEDGPYGLKHVGASMQMFYM